ncbi:hypothetical protein ARTHRO9AX_220248 [Arthrobacter sp. 9AX]|nr:hypothetical protein ARTHRO9AX_220248 [Arthrobacter sp. 9AX]
MDIVHTFRLRSRPTGLELGRFPYVFAGSQYFQGRECSSSPTSGTTNCLVRGDFAWTCVQSLWLLRSDGWVAALAWLPFYSGVWGGGVKSLADGPSACFR